MGWKFNPFTGTFDYYQPSAAPDVLDVYDDAVYDTGVYDDAEAEAGVFKSYQVPTGSVNGVNDTFGLADTITAGSLTVYLNGLVEPVTELGSTFVFAVPPQTGDVIYCSYQVN